jgi:hypothetical protein
MSAGLWLMGLGLLLLIFLPILLAVLALRHEEIESEEE